MVCTEVVCEWFKKLNPHTRIDIMCGLLHMCVPPELRFLGTFLENLGKKDYHKLRDAEIKANNHIDLAKNTNASINNTTSNNDSSTSSGSSTATGAAGSSCNSSSSSSSNIMSEESLRNKLSLSLALLYSSNQQCSNILFKLLEANVSRALQVMPSMAVVTIYEILTILVMAANHPAFTFSQRLTMAELYRSAEKAAEGLIPKDKCLCCHNCTSSPSPPKPGTGPYCCSRCVPNTSPTHKDKAHVTKINVKGTRKLVDKPKEFILQVTWSNGEVTEVYKTFQEVQEFSNKFVRMFEDTNLHKTDRKIPSLQGQYREEILEDVSFQNICLYTGQLEKLPQRFLECDHLVNFFTASESSRSSPSRSTNFTPNNEQPVISQCHQKSFNTASPSGDINNRQPHHSPFYTTAHYSQLSSNSHNTCSNRSVVTPQMNQSVSPLYSPTSSPPPQQAAPSSHTSSLQQSNSRSASPGSVDSNCLANNKSKSNELDHLLKVDEEKIHVPDNHKNGRDKRPLNGLIDCSIIGISSPGGTAGVNVPHHLPWTHPASATMKHPYSIPFANVAAAPGQQQQGPPSRPGMAPSPLTMGNLPTVLCCYSQPTAATPGPPNNADSSPGGSDYCSQPPSPGPPSNANVAMVAASSSSVASDDSDRVKNGKDGDPSLEQDFRKKESQKPNLKLSQQMGSKTSVMRAPPEDQTKGGSIHLPVSHYVDLQQLPMGSYGAAPDLLPHRQQMIPSRSAFNAQPAHTNIGIHPKNMINMPLDGKSSSPMVPLFPPGLPNSVDNNTTVVSVMVNSNTAGPGDSAVGSGGPLFSPHLNSPAVRTRNAAVHQPCTRSAPSAVCTSNTMASTCSSASSPPPRHTIGNVKNGNGPLCPNSVVSQPLLPAGTPGDPCSISVLSCSSDQTGGQPPPMNYHGQCTNQSSVTTTTITYSSQAYSMSSPSPATMGRSRRCNSCGCEGHCTNGSYHFGSVLTSPMTAPANTPPPHQWQHLSAYMFPNTNGMIPFPNLTPYGHNPDLIYNHPNVGLVHLNSSSQVTAQPPPPSSTPNPHCVLNPMCNYGGLGNGGPPPPHQQHPLLAPPLHHTMTAVSNKHKPSIQSCYNCGGVNHMAVDCKESTMESMTGQYHLNYEDKAVAE